MISKKIIVVIITSLVITSCKEKTTETKQTLPLPTVQSSTSAIVTKTLTNPDGSKIKLTFNNTTGIAIVEFNNEKIELLSQKTASGIWYKNDQYELRGKGQNIELKKDGKLIFSHKG
ncbi:MliC family protein [Flavobacterium sp. UMI-01]|uniref:MliC family protein n=1 Tax=Flavobacterium sp. UMI-01 TaxID=1441053 RepID=UPI001C7D469F|nr:MliC family protein [Flavobacterium sp. UMI-01]